jgi:hypothetical protein
MLYSPMEAKFGDPDKWVCVRRWLVRGSTKRLLRDPLGNGEWQQMTQ